MRILLLLLLLVPGLTQARSLCVCLKCAFLQHKHYWIASGAMKPALPVGSCVIAALHDRGDPVPTLGEIIIFQHQAKDEVFVFRLIATEGQTVAMVDGHPVLDGVPVEIEPLEDSVEPYLEQGGFGGWPVCKNNPGLGEDCLADRFRETLPNGISFETRNVRNQRSDNFGPVEVPPGHVFVLGDNRDNAADSRYSAVAGGRGMVPVDNIIGVIEEIRD